MVIERTEPGDDQVGILIEASAPVQNLFARAQEGLERSDWKFVIDCLQRIIDDPEDSLVPRSDGAIEHGMLYESVRRQAIRTLTSMPPEGLRAYRLLYDGKARGLFQRGRDTHDPQLLRQVVDRYLLTGHGDDAADLLASWALDEGRPGEVVVLLSDLLDLCPEGDVPGQRIVGKLAAAYVLLGRTQQAESAVSRFATGAPSVPDWFMALGDPKRAEAAIRVRSGAAVAEAPQDNARLAPATQSVQPTLAESAPWRHSLGGDAEGAWRHIGTFQAGGPLALPVMTPVVDGGRLHARVPGGSIALDASDLSVVWRSDVEEPAGGGARSGAGEAPGADPGRGWEADAAFTDYVAGGLTVAHGLVLTIEDAMRPAFVQAQRQRGRTPREPASPAPNRLVATDASTGEVRWQRGSTGDASDPLADARFRDAPVAVGNTLWAPYALQGDLYIGVLEPDDGSLVHRIGLGSLPRSTSETAGSTTSTPMAFADGVVYVPSGDGVVFAVDATDYHLRWAHAYLQPKEETPRQFIFRAAQAHRNEPLPVEITEEEHRFLSTRPIVSGGLVIVSPSDSDQVLAFSAAGGEFRWSVPGDEWSYLIGADAQRIWLGGHDVSCLSLADGSPLWSVEVSGAPTGRAALCGQLLHVPLSDGLWTIDAATGDVVRRQAMPPSQIPLGNLACSETALFSIEPSSVRKLPDVERTIAWAQKRLESHPDDLQAVRELSWMYLIKGEPKSAYDLLRAEEVVMAGGEREKRALARVRIEALLAMAAQGGSSADTALTWLREAREYATTPSERLRCSVAIADQQRAMGNAAGAFDTLLEAGMAADSDHPVDIGELVTASARVAIGRRLRELKPELAESERRHLGARIEEDLAAAAEALRRPGHAHSVWTMSEDERAAQAMLRAAGDLLRHEPAGTFALVTLADWEARRAAFERAEQLLFELLRGSDDEHAKLAAHLRLCSLYADPVYARTGMPEICLDALDARFGGSALPEKDPAPAPSGLSAPAVNTVHEWVDWIRAARADSGVGGSQAGIGIGGTESLTVSFGERVEPLWTLYLISTSAEEPPSAPFEATGELKQLIDHAAPIGPPRLAKLDSPAAFPGAVGSEALLDRLNRALDASRLLIHAPDDLLLGLDPHTGELLWHAALTLPDTAEDSFAPVQWQVGATRRRAVYDGQTAVINASGGLYAAGLVTGRRLWVRPGESESSEDTYSADLRMAVGPGVVAAVPRPGHLALIRLYDGSVLWDRDLRGEPVDQIDIVADRVITQDGQRQRVHLFDLQDGRLVRQVLFRQPDLRSGVVSLPIVVGGAGSGSGPVVCGPDSDGTTEQVVGVDLRTGEEVWRADLDKPLVQLFQPESGYLGAGLVGGDVRVLDTGTGELVLDRRVSSVHAVIDGRMNDGTFVVQAVDARRERWEPVLVGMDIATTTELWRREDLSGQGWSELTFEIVGGVIPSLVEFGSRENVRGRNIGLALVNARTGENNGGVFDLTPSRSRNVYNGVFEARPNALVVGTGAGVEAVPVHGNVDTAEE